MAKSQTQIAERVARELADSPNSPGVVNYRLGQVEIAVKEGFQKHDALLNSLTSKFVTQSEHLIIENRLSSLESDRKWIVRLVIGAVVFSLLALIGIGFKIYK